MLSLRGSIFLSALFHIVLFLALLLTSGTGRARVVYKPQYHVRLVQPKEVSSLGKPQPSLAAKPTPPPAVVQPPAKKVILPEKKEALPKKKEAEKPQPPKKAPEKKAEKKPETSATPPKKPEPPPEQVLEEALARIQKKAGSRGKVAANVPEGPSSGWEERQQEIEYSAYYDQVERAVRENWIPPESMDFEKGPVMTVVSLTLLPDGRVLKSYVEESSGDPHFDQSVMRAILKSTPFPPPPIGLKQQNFELGLRFHSTPQLP